MSALNLRQLSFVVLGLAATVAHGAAADFRVGVRSEEIDEVGIVNHTTVSSLSAEFSFLPPPSWTREIDVKSGTVVFTSSDFRSVIRLRLPSAEVDAIPALKPEELKQTALVDKVEPKIVEESPCYTAGLKGLAVDAEHILENGLRVRTREAFIPAPGGMVQVTLSSPVDQFTIRQADLSRLLNSFRASKRDATQPGGDAAKR